MKFYATLFIIVSRTNRRYDNDKNQCSVWLRSSEFQSSVRSLLLSSPTILHNRDTFSPQYSHSLDWSLWSLVESTSPVRALRFGIYVGWRKESARLNRAAAATKSWGLLPDGYSATGSVQLDSSPETHFNPGPSIPQSRKRKTVRFVYVRISRTCVLSTVSYFLLRPYLCLLNSICSPPSEMPKK